MIRWKNWKPGKKRQCSAAYASLCLVIWVLNTNTIFKTQSMFPRQTAPALEKGAYPPLPPPSAFSILHPHTGAYKAE